MNKSVYALIIFSLLILGNVSALTIEDLQTSTEENTQILAQQNAELTAKLSSMEQKLNTLASEEELLNMLEGHLNVTNAIMDNFRTSLIVSFVVISFCVLGIGAGMYFYFKGQGRV